MTMRGSTVPCRVRRSCFPWKAAVKAHPEAGMPGETATRAKRTTPVNISLRANPPARVMSPLAAAMGPTAWETAARLETGLELTVAVLRTKLPAVTVVRPDQEPRVPPVAVERLDQAARRHQAPAAPPEAAGGREPQVLVDQVATVRTRETGFRRYRIASFCPHYW